ncbi:uncharacterized protein LOC123202450 [Mangifera indica]|uniref:uncharacterized protein LOC123202450 n=1 Tax=Mangifera indica TaxID=29780 RepID=UPI001CF982E5|nr:uncharacterized protein LOC123202450 [Mangifera indica]
MAESHHKLSICLLTAMDYLWFHHAILLSQPTSLLVPKAPLKTHSLSPNQYSLSSTPVDIQDPEKSSASAQVSPLVEDSNDKIKGKEVNLKERPTRLNALQKSMSCRSMWDLELEEVKGFMDLGFIFKKENLNPQMIRVVPGLQRVKSFKNKPCRSTKPEFDAEDIEEDEHEHEKGIMRPYLSEAWLIKRPDSPLLNLKIPRVITAADMKKHLKFWAKIVASEIQQEC